MVFWGKGWRKVYSHFNFFLNSLLKYEQFYGVILCSISASRCFHTFNSFSLAEMPKVELQTGLYFYFLVFKKFKFSVSENTVISFRSKTAWDFSFVMF